MIGHGEQCVAEPARIASRPVPPSAPPLEPEPEPAQEQAIAAPTFRLTASAYAPGAPIQIRFAQAIRSTARNRAWITVAEHGASESSYGTWKYVDDRATAAVLDAPAKDGAYEVRLHTNYPAKSFHVVHAEPFAVKAGAAADAGETPRAQQRFTVAHKSVRSGEPVDVTFAVALQAAPREQFWITIVALGTADTSWGAYEYVPAGARRMKLTAPADAGDYEIRLHANYPKQSTNVVHRVALHVESP